MTALVLKFVVAARLSLSQVFWEILPQIICLCCITLIAVGAITKCRRAPSRPGTLMVIGSVGVAALGIAMLIFGLLDYAYYFTYENDAWWARHLSTLCAGLLVAGTIGFTIGYCWEAFAKPAASAQKETGGEGGEGGQGE